MVPCIELNNKTHTIFIVLIYWAFASPSLGCTNYFQVKRQEIPLTKNQYNNIRQLSDCIYHSNINFNKLIQFPDLPRLQIANYRLFYQGQAYYNSYYALLRNRGTSGKSLKEVKRVQQILKNSKILTKKVCTNQKNKLRKSIWKQTAHKIF